MGNLRLTNGVNMERPTSVKVSFRRILPLKRYVRLSVLITFIYISLLLTVSRLLRDKRNYYCVETLRSQGKLLESNVLRDLYLNKLENCRLLQLLKGAQ